MSGPIEVEVPAYADLDDARIAYARFGAIDAAPLMLVRGLGTQMIEWPRALIDGFVASGYQVIVFDNRDVGLSSDHAGRPYALADMAGDCVALMDHLGIARARVLGISMGGMIVQHLAFSHGERFEALVSVMSSTGNPMLPPPEPHIRDALLAPAPETLTAAIEQNAEGRGLFGSPAWPLSADERLHLARRALTRAWRPDGVKRQFEAIVRDGARNERLSRVTKPVLVIHGRDDPLVPLAGGEDTANAIPGARLEIIDGMGHDLPEALAPRLVELVVGFFRE